MCTVQLRIIVRDVTYQVQFLKGSIDAQALPAKQRSGAFSVKFCVMTKLGLPARIDEGKNLYLYHNRHAEKHVNELLDQAPRAEVQLEMLRGRPISGRKLLEGRPARQLTPMSYLGRNTCVTGIDRDLVTESPTRMTRPGRFCTSCAKRELENYSNEELLTVTLEISWRKATEGEDTVTAITSGAHQQVTGCEK
jgi:hypothetical protein